MASREHKAKGVEICAAVEVPLLGIDPRDVIPEAQRARENTKPSRIVACPVDPFERHPHDFSSSGAGSRIENLFRDRSSWSYCSFRQSSGGFSREHLCGQFRIAEIPGCCRVGHAAKAFE